MKSTLGPPTVTGLLIFVVLFGTPAAAQVPDGWWLGGSTRTEYEVSSSLTTVHRGQSAAVISSKQPTVSGFGTLAQTISADQYRQKRIRFTGFVKTRDVTGSAGLWMRVDNKYLTTQPLAFDNMANRSIRGTTDWHQYAIVLDVIQLADEISFGVTLEGGGAVWLDDVSLEEVDSSVPVTDLQKPKQPWPLVPRNLDFER